MRYKELDALRGVAALLVVIFHFTMETDLTSQGFKLGTTGVDLFFMISGFVILLSLNYVNNSSEFVMNRVSRLYPTYWACVTCTFIFMIIKALYDSEWWDVSVLQYLANLTMFQYYLGIQDLDSPYWTMIIEMIFYGVMLLLFYFNWLRFLTQIGVTVILIVDAAILLNIDHALLNKIMHWFPLLQFVPLFFAGTVFYNMATANQKSVKHYTLLILCLVSQILLFEYSGRSKLFITHAEYACMLTIHFIVFTLFVHGKLKFIVSRFTLFLGEISFALYLIHQKISLGHIIPFLVRVMHFNLWTASLLTLVIIILLATFITYFIGIPLSKKMKTKLYTLFNEKAEG